MSTVLEQLRQSVIDGNAKEVEAQVKQALDEGIRPDVILNTVMIPAMSEVGEKFESGEYFVPEMLISARAMQAGLKLLKPLLAAGGTEPIGTVAIGTVKGDLHDIGKSLVGMMLEGAGFEIMDLGVDVPAEKFIEAIQNGAGLVAMSALLTTTMPNMQTTIQSITSAGLRDKVRVMVGGAPLTEAYAKQIGADGYASDASSAVRKAKELLGL